LFDFELKSTIVGKVYKFQAGKLKPVAQAEKFGEEFGGLVLKNKVKKVVFDRGDSRYSGRIKAFAEGLRKAGLDF